MTVSLIQPTLVPNESAAGALQALMAELREVREGTNALTVVAAAVHRAVPGAEMASLNSVHRGAPRTLWCTAPSALRLDEVQSRRGEGPTIDALSGPAGTTILVSDLLRDERWPVLRQPGARDRGVRSVLSTGLFAADDPAAKWVGRAAVNLYAGPAGVFTAGDQDTMMSLAIYGAMAMNVMAANQVIEDLKAGMATRTVIGQAQGILMARHGLSADQAFDRLKALSQDLNIKLRDVAEELARTGEAPAQRGVLKRRPHSAAPRVSTDKFGA